MLRFKDFCITLFDT